MIKLLSMLAKGPSLPLPGDMVKIFISIFCPWILFRVLLSSIVLLGFIRIITFIIPLIVSGNGTNTFANDPESIVAIYTSGPSLF